MSKKQVHHTRHAAPLSVIEESVKFSFRAMRRIWMYYWNFIPILGWILLGGYTISVINAKHELPKWKIDWKRGFLFALSSGVWGVIMYTLGYWEFGWIIALCIGLNLPVMLAAYALGDDIKDAFNILGSTKLILRNFKAYLVLWGRLILLSLFYLVCTIPIITAIVTIPGAYFSNWYLVARFMDEAK